MAVAASFTSTQVSGVAPLGVVFDATATTGTTSQPFHELHYVWDFGDREAGSWTYGGGTKERNKDQGPVAAHVYKWPGRYTVTLTVYEADGSTDTDTTTINVGHPSKVFPTTNTVCVNKVGDATFTGAPAGASQQNTDSWATIVGYCTAGKRVLLKRGSTWDYSGSGVEWNNTGPGILGAYGTGNNPVINCTRTGAPDAPMLEMGASAAFGNWRIVDVDFKYANQVDGSNVFFFGGYHCENILIQGCTFTNVNTPISINPWSLYWCGPNRTEHEGIIFSETTINTLKNVDGAYVMYSGAVKHLALIGNDWYNDTTVDTTGHLVRDEWMRYGVIAHNRFRTDCRGHVLKIGGPLWAEGGWNDTAWPVNQYSEYNCIAHNDVHRLSTLGSGPWDLQIGVQNADRDERGRHFLVENNYFNVGNTGGDPVQVHVRFDYVTVRNNCAIIASLTNRNERFVHIEDTANIPVPVGLRVYNNSIYYPGDASQTFIVTNVDTGVSDVVIRNNVAKSPSVPSPAFGWGNGSWIASDNNFRDTPGWSTDPPTQASHFALTSSSACIDAGYASGVPLMSSYGWRTRPYGVANDQGAFESGSEVVPESVSLIRDSRPISTIDGDATQISVTLSSAFPNNNLKFGQKIKISGTTNYNGVYTIARVSSQTLFYIDDTTHNYAAENTGTAGGDYANLVDWIAAKAGNLKTQDVCEVAEVYNDFASGITCTAQLNFTTSWTTDRTRKIKIRVPQTERTDPTSWGTGARIKYSNYTFPSAGHVDGMIQIDSSLDVEILGLELDGTGGASATMRGVQVWSTSGGGGSLVLRDVIAHATDDLDDAFDIDAGTVAGYLYELTNCIASGYTDDAFSWSVHTNGTFSTSSYAHNCLGYGLSKTATSGFHSDTNLGIILRNCVAANNAVDYDSGTGFWSASCTNNASEDATAVGSNAVTSLTPANVWTTPGSDFSCLSSASVLVGAGSTAITHTQDVRTCYHSGALNIGPFQNPGFFGRKTYAQQASANNASTDKSGAAHQPVEDLIYVPINLYNDIIKLNRSTGAVYGDTVVLGSTFDDIESLEYLGDHPHGTWMTCNEGDTAAPGTPLMIAFDLTKDAVNESNVVTFDISGKVWCVTNMGVEGVAYNPANDKFYIVTQSGIQGDYGGLWEVDLDATAPVCTRLTAWTDTLVARGYLPSAGYASDAALVNDPLYANSIFVLLNETTATETGWTRVVEIDRLGNVLSQLTGLAVGKVEGMCFDAFSSNDLILVGEQADTDWWRWAVTTGYTVGPSASTFALDVTDPDAVPGAVTLLPAASTFAPASTNPVASTTGGGVEYIVFGVLNA